ncbi:MAG: prolyl oligopeptidase family serine peptidase, partial [Planctomycetes bacterium]|nr:prolyl oligopeptidase family serine peptidase [Planctomycetota bacterium]
ARSNTDFQGIGEDDVLRAIDEVKADFSIDEDRVILGGYSMGGMGVWTIGGHYPHLFAGLWAMSSRSDFYMWKDTKPEEIAPFKRKLAEGEFGASMLQNYSNLPMLMMHGSEDFGIPVGQSRTMYNRLKQKGMDIQYTEIEGEGHYFFYDETKPRPQAVKWLKNIGGKDPPKKFSFKTYNLKYDRAYWANLLGFEDWSRPARVSCELGAESARIRLKTENVMALRIRPPGRLISQKQDLQIVWNGEKWDVDPQADGSFVIGSYPDEKKREKSLWKTPDLCGPVREAFADPFIMVHAGQGTPSYQLAIRTAIDWMRFAKGVPQVIPASEVTENLLKSHNLFLFGTPAENKLTRQIMPDLPITIGEKTIQVRDREYETKKYGFWMIYPNPLSPGNYVVLNAGIPWGQNLPYNHKYDLIPDFIVYTDEVSDEIEWCNKYLCAGFFDQRWQVSEKSIWFSKEPR